MTFEELLDDMTQTKQQNDAALDRLDELQKQLDELQKQVANLRTPAAPGWWRDVELRLNGHDRG